MISYASDLDSVHSLLGLSHAGAGGGVPVGLQLCGAQVLCPKDDPIQKVVWVTWTRHCLGKKQKKC